MRSYKTFINEKKEKDIKGKYDNLIKQLEDINKNNKDVKSVIAMLKQGRDLKESFDDIIQKEEVVELIKEIEGV